ncbi:MAG TPA: pseudaminic acid synthase [Solimonas sp.]|nr:pseudaminic acid synthase [Solimonas sp.]
MKIGNREIGRGHAPFVIAEMSGNHNGSLDRALAIVDAAAEAGAHAIKLQTYTADTMTLNLRHGDFYISDPKSLWHGRTLHDLYQEAHTPWDWHAPIFERARQKGLISFSTPFDASAVDFLESLNVPAYKVASFENTDLPLIRRVAATGKPVIISTGMATVAEIQQAVEAAREGGCRDLILLKCTSNYPANPADSNLVTIPHMAALFGCEIGLSDHTLGIGAAVAATALGATVIEKHFTLSRDDGGVDSAFSLDPAELKLLMVETERAAQAVGRIHYGLTEAEQRSRVFRRTLYFVAALKAGQVIEPQHVRAIRPGGGLPPGQLERVIGMRVGVDVEIGTPVTWAAFGSAG